MSTPIDAGTLRACCSVLCDDCRDCTPRDCYRDVDREWMHAGSGQDCEAAALRNELDPLGTVLGAMRMTYECPRCGAQYEDAQAVPCCEECDPERFS